LSTDTKTRRPEFLEKMMAAVPRHEPEVEEARESVKEARLAIPTPMLDIVFRDGRIRSFGYAYLKGVDFEPGDKVTLKFVDGAEIIVEGRGLARHRQQIRLHRADEIRECPQHELALEDEGISQVESIHITEGDEHETRDDYGIK
jgi:hypothetical protein